MDTEFINLTSENLLHEHLCCIIRSRKPHPGVEAKRQWLFRPASRGSCLSEVERKGKRLYRICASRNRLGSCSWRQLLLPILLVGFWQLQRKRVWEGADGVLFRGCQREGKIRHLYAWRKRQKPWLSDQAFAKEFGFECVDTADPGYELLACSFDGTTPRFAPNAKIGKIANQELTIYYDMQCPYIHQSVETIRQYCAANDVPVSFIQVDTLQKQRNCPVYSIIGPCFIKEISRP